ncbi:MAG: hypothetical protein HY881_08905 [Deltaproteobacteria bacterium]|nr:hypothetical protein [Deltaproteobacteria bacterium]
MTQTILMNWEVFLDAFGVGCCALTALYLIKMKRNTASKQLISGAAKSEDADPFTANPIDLPADMPFGGVLASVKNNCYAGDGQGAANDPYDEARRLLDLGMGAHQIASRIKIPQCEIELIASLRQIQSAGLQTAPLKTDIA